VNSVLYLRVPYTAGKLSGVHTTRDLSSSAQVHGVISRLGTADYAPKSLVAHANTAVVYT
jgi:hypothetical protein